MERDWDLTREILLTIEKMDDAVGPGWIDLEFEGRSPKEISYHVQILDEAGLIEAEKLSTLTEFHWAPKRLTWEGHEFLDAAREDTRWEKAKKLALEKTGSLSFVALREILLSLLRGESAS